MSNVKKKIAQVLGIPESASDPDPDSEVQTETKRADTAISSTTQGGPPMTDKTNKTFQAVTDNLKHGAKIAGSEEACHLLIGIVRRALGKSYPGYFDTELGRMLEPLVVATAVHYLSTQYGFIPNSNTVAKVAEYCMQGTGREVAASLLKQLEPAFEAITKINILEQEPEALAESKRSSSTK